MRKHLYLIKKAKIKSWLKFWLLTKDQVKYILSEILEGFSFDLQNTVKKYFKVFNIFGNSVQDGTPTPTNPVPIESVADDVNLFDKEKASINSGTIKTVLDTGVRITLSSSGTFRYSGIEIGGTELLGKTITLYSAITPSSNNNGAIFLYYGNSSNIAVSAVAGGALTNTGSKTITIANEFPTNCDRIYGLFYANRNGTGNTNDYVDYTNLKIQYGDTASPYSPYNYGTFTIDFEGQTENYNYTFITKPLRSLPNGVRDSLEDDGIHRKIGIQTGTLSQTTTITLSDAKQNGAYMCNIKSAGTLTGKTIELEAGDYEIIYELAEETVEPYTEEQQEQYNKIKELYTFDGTTNISSTDVVPPYLQIQYYMKGE